MQRSKGLRGGSAFSIYSRENYDHFAAKAGSRMVKDVQKLISQGWKELGASQQMVFEEKWKSERSKRKKEAENENQPKRQKSTTSNTK